MSTLKDRRDLPSGSISVQKLSTKQRYATIVDHKESMISVALTIADQKQSPFRCWTRIADQKLSTFSLAASFIDQKVSTSHSVTRTSA